MYRQQCVVISNKKLAPGHFVMRLRSEEISRAARPGQFVQILCTDSFKPLLPRPFSFLTTGGDTFSILYQVVGEGTKHLSESKKDARLTVLGPLGNGFSLDAPSDSLTLVGGGVGIPPLYHLSQWLVKKTQAKNIHVFLGARNKSLLLCQSDFKKLKVNLTVTTDDGSAGQKGVVTKALEDFFKNKKKSISVYTCGPAPMLKAVAALSRGYQIPYEVSVEEPMACGFGVCLGCAVRVKDTKDGRYAMACTEGPVFQGDKLLWK